MGSQKPLFSGSAVFLIQYTGILHHQLGRHTGLYSCEMGNGPGCYNHRTEQKERKIRRGYEALADSFLPRDRVLAFGYHPEVLDLNCCVQSYYDVTGSGGDVYLVKKLAYFEEFLEYAGIDYFFVQAGYLADQPRAFEIIEDMIEEGTLRDLTFEWGNMKARVALEEKTEEFQTEEAERFRQNYCMRENGFR